MHQLVPEFILRKLGQEELEGEFQATALFIDITGFSTMTETLMQHGQHGAEVLADLMCSVFDPMITTVYQYGGFVSTLAGDAITAIFPSNNKTELSVRQALASAWDIRESVRDRLISTEEYGNFDISARIGLALGSIEWGIITSEHRSAYFFRGAAIQKCSQAEQRAMSGQIIVEENAFEFLKDQVEGSLDEGFYTVTRLNGTLPEKQDIVEPDTLNQNLTDFFPNSLVNQSHTGEFRQVVNLFIQLPTVRNKAQLQIFMRSLFRLQRKYGGLLNRLDFGDKGAHLLLFWGVPRTYENDVERALNFILAMQEDTSTPIHAGITYNISHAGFIGNRLREEYTCYGKGVNLSARLMQSAPRGSIWIDQPCARRAEKHHQVEYLGEYKYKGFSDPQPVFSLQEKKDIISQIFKNKLVGRQKELDQLASFVSPIQEGQFCGAIVVFGEAGSGKSRLIHEFERSNVFESGDILWARCQADQLLQEAFNPFRYWLKQYFDISDSHSSARNKRNFNYHLDQLVAQINDNQLIEELDRTRSFIASLLGLYWPDSLYEQTEGQVRYNNILSGITSLLIAESTLQPVIIQLEDVHWLDRDSRAFIDHLFEKIHSTNPGNCPIAVIATARPTEQTGLLGSIQHDEIHLSSLSNTEIKLLVENVLQSAADPQLIQVISDHASGNPFFIEQIATYLLEHDSLTAGEQGLKIKTTDQFPIPTDIRNVLIARFDQLEAELKEVVQVASVLGREFDTNIITQILEHQPRIQDNLQRGEKKGLWTTLGRNRYIFNHILMQESAYRMQIRTQREKLHGRAVTAIEHSFQGDLSPHFGELAYHSKKAKNYPRAFSYFHQAAQRAANNYANQEAIGAFTEAIHLIDEISPDPIQVANLYLERGHAFNLAGEFNQARADYETGQSIAHDLNQTKIKWQALIDLGKLWASRDYQKTQDFFEKALQLAQAIQDSNLVGISLNAMGNWFMNNDNPMEAMNYHLQALDIFKQAGDKRQLANTFDYLGLTSLQCVDMAAAISYYNQAIDLYRALEDTPGLITSLIGRGATSFNLTYIGYILPNQMPTNIQDLLEGIQLARSLGSPLLELMAYWLLTLIYNLQGDIAKAIETSTLGLKLSKEINHREWVVSCLYSLGEVYSGLHAFDKAFQLLEEAKSLANELQSRYWINLITGTLANTHLLAGNLEESQKQLAEILISNFQMNSGGDRYCWSVFAKLSLAQGLPAKALEISNQLVKTATRIDQTNVISSLWMIQGDAYSMLGEQEKAREKMTQAIDNAKLTGETFLLWHLQSRLYRICANLGLQREAEHAYNQAQAILNQISETIDDPLIRENFLDHAHQQLKPIL